jgi:hypothetical protein
VVVFQNGHNSESGSTQREMQRNKKQTKGSCIVVIQGEKKELGTDITEIN